ncbi:ileal sodium/bile acid cotransporter-like isoform X2 [Ciona intestinalis]
MVYTTVATETFKYSGSGEAALSFNSCSTLDDESAMMKLPGCSSATRVKFSRALSITLIACVSIVMFAMGCKVKIAKMKERITRPWGILIGFFCQFGIMPLCAFGLAKLFKLTRGKALVVLVMGCLPGGNTSNLITYWSNGDLDLSITMTAMSTILAFAMMPLCLFVYGRSFVQGVITIPYLSIALVLAMFIIPVGVGMLLSYCKPTWADTMAKVGAVLGLFVIIAAATVGIILYPAAYNIPHIFWEMGFILPLLGYVFGYVISAALSGFGRSNILNAKQWRTIAIETGTQNTQLCTTIVQLNYGCTCMILEMYAYPLVYFLFQVVVALLFCLSFQVYSRCRGNQEPEPPVELTQANKPHEDALDDNSNRYATHMDNL